MEKSSKFALSFPAELFEAVEVEREARHESRSEFFQRAAEALLRRRREEEWDRQYAEAYRKYPDTLEEIEAAGRAASIVLAAVPWEE